MSARSRRSLLAAAAAALLSACASPLRSPPPGSTDGFWQGRIAIQVLGAQADSFSGDFELSGQAHQGELALYSPLGTTVARMEWTPGSARLISGGRETSYPSLAELALRGTGVALPLAALFDWLEGRPTPAEGWEVDLSAHAEGRIHARRSTPLPPVELRVLLSR